MDVMPNYITILKIIKIRITLDSFTLADNLIKIHHTDYLSSSIIPAQSVDNAIVQEYLAAIT